MPCTFPHYIGGGQGRQALQPQAGGFGRLMPKLPRLYDLVGLPDPARYDANRVLQRDARDRCGQQQAHEVQRLRLFLRLILEPTRAADGEVRAWRVGNHQIPPVPQDILHLALVVRAWRFAW